MGVLLSIGAHGALLAFGPQTNFSFAALSQAAQKTKAEETIVPILELSAAEQGRLPDFAQPRRPPSLTGLSSLALPPGIPFNPNSTFKRVNPSSQSMPSALGRTSLGGKLGPLNTTIPSTLPLDLFRNSGVRSLPTPQPSASSNVPPSTYEPLPQLPSSVDSPPSTINGNDPISEVEPTDTLTTAQALEGLQAAGSNPNPNRTIENPFTTPPDNEAGQTVEIEEPESISMAPAQGDGSQIVEDSNGYNDALTSEEAVEKRRTEWYESTAKDKETVAQSTAEIGIDSGFKACREISPIDGIIGVLVNPDGTQESVTVLRSTGYDVLNRLALSTLEYEDFGQPEVPTQYEVEVKVNYQPQGCVEPIPEAAPAE